MEEQSNNKFHLVGAVVVIVVGLIIYAQRSYEAPVRITARDGDMLAEKFGSEGVESSNVVPLPGAEKSAAGDPSDPGGTPAQQTRSTLTAEHFQWNTNHWLTGRVILHGTPPTEKPLPLDPECSALARAAGLPTALTRNFVVGTNAGLADVVVSLINSPGKMSGYLVEPVNLQLEGCQFRPFINVVLAGQEIMLRNHDSEFHSISAYPRVPPNGTIDFALIPGAPAPSTSFDGLEENIAISTQDRPWMKSFFTVLPHPFFSVTDSNGWFRIPLPPKGERKIKAHHRLLPAVTRTIELTGATNATLDFTLEYQPPAKKAAAK